MALNITSISAAGWLPLSADYSFDDYLRLRTKLSEFEDGYNTYHQPLYDNAKDVTFNRQTNFTLTSAIPLFQFMEESVYSTSNLGSYITLRLNGGYVTTARESNVLIVSAVELDERNYFRVISNDNDTVSIMRDESLLMTVNDIQPYDITLEPALSIDGASRQQFKLYELTKDMMLISTYFNNPYPGYGPDIIERFLSFSHITSALRAIGMVSAAEYNYYNPYVFRTSGYDPEYIAGGLDRDQSWVRYHNSLVYKQNNRNVEILNAASGIQINRLVSNAFYSDIDLSANRVDINIANTKNMMTPEYEYQAVPYDMLGILTPGNKPPPSVDPNPEKSLIFATRPINSIYQAQSGYTVFPLEIAVSGFADMTNFQLEFETDPQTGLILNQPSWWTYNNWLTSRNLFDYGLPFDVSNIPGFGSNHTFDYNINEETNIHTMTYAWPNGTIKIENYIEPPPLPEPLRMSLTIPDDSGFVEYYHTDDHNYNYYINWGDGSDVEHIINPPAEFATHHEYSGVSHTYDNAGSYQISVSGTAEHLQIGNGYDYVTSVDQLGDLGWKSLEYFANACWNLTAFNVGITNTSKLTSTLGMFTWCESLVTLDLRSFDTSKVTDMSFMLESCTNLATININTWDTSSVESMEGMFKMCTSLEYVVFEGFDFSNVKSTRQMFEYCYNLQYIDPAGATPPIALVYANEMFSQCYLLEWAPINYWITASTTTIQSIFADCERMGIYESDPAALDVSTWDVSNVTDMGYALYNCGCTDLDVSGWNTSNVVSMPRVFSKNAAITYIPVSNWNTGNVTDMSALFQECNALSDVDVSLWDTSKVATFDRMFKDCNSLTTAYVGSWDVSSATTFESMFENCTSLASIPVGGWDTSSAIIFDYIFKGCTALTNIDVSLWDTSHVTNVISFVQDCTSLTTLSIAGWIVPTITRYDDFANGVTLDMPDYSNILMTLAAQNVSLNESFHGGFSKYSFTAKNSRDLLTDVKGWNIIDGGLGEDTNFKMTLETVSPHYVRFYQDPAYAATYDFDINWGDGSAVEHYTGIGPNVEHTYTIPNFPQIQISGSAGRLQPGGLNGATLGVAFSVDQLGDLNWKCLSNMFIYAKPYVKACSFQNTILRDGIKMDQMFRNCSTIRHIDLTPVDLSNVTDLSWFAGFDDTYYSQSIRTVQFDTNAEYPQITSLSCALFQAQGLTGVELPKVRPLNCNRMFYYCWGLKSANTDNINASWMTSAYQMFYRCQGYPSFDLRSWNVSSLIDAREMFNYCYFTTGFNIDGWQLPTGVKLRNMFLSCGSTSAINADIFATVDTSNLGIYGMFKGCSQVRNLCLTGIDVKNCTNFYQLFQSYQNLTALNIDGWNVSAVSDYSYIGESTKLHPYSYTRILTAWAGQNVMTKRTSVGFGTSKYYSAALTSKHTLTATILNGGKQWTMTDGGLVAGP